MPNPPKPTKVQINEGDPRKRGVHKLDEALELEPKAQPGLPDCPEHLSGMARTAWEFLKPELEIMDLDRKPDAMTLEGACVMYARAVAADAKIETHGILLVEEIYDKQGNEIGTRMKCNPAVIVSDKCWKGLLAFCTQFGLSPLSRTRLAVEKKQPQGDLMAILSAPREKKAKVQ